ncbi:MAG: acetyl-CoA carboxylase biotin carboxyl carrier protein subunit [Bacteroidales bacterium]
MSVKEENKNKLTATAAKKATTEAATTEAATKATVDKSTANAVPAGSSTKTKVLALHAAVKAANITSKAEEKAEEKAEAVVVANEAEAVNSESKTKQDIKVEIEAEPEKEPTESFFLEDTEYLTFLPKKYKERSKYTHPNPNAVVAFMPGTIRKIFVEPGDLVKKGDKLMVLDAMKMNNELLSPIDGVVEKIPVSTNESVPKHTVLIDIRALEHGDVLSKKKKKK